MQLVVLIGPPDTSLSVTAGITGAHPRFAPLPQGQLLTALAHAGIEANIDNAAYDHILAGPAQRLFLERVEGGLEAWPAACRAYLDSLVESAAAIANGAPYLLDASPAYARLWPTIARVLGDARPIILVRNPVATAAEVLGASADPRDAGHLLQSWHHLAGIVREEQEAAVVRYENLLRAPEAALRVLEEAYGGDCALPASQLGELDAAAITESAWPHELAADARQLRRVRRLLERVPPRDLEGLGYPWKDAWAPVEAALGREVTASRVRTRWHGAGRVLRARAAAFTAARPGVAATVRKLKLACDVLLRD